MQNHPILSFSSLVLAFRMCSGTKFHKPDCQCFKVHWSPSWGDCENSWSGCAFGGRAREWPALLQQLNQYNLHKPHADHGMQLLQPAAATVYKNTLQCADRLHQGTLHLVLKVSAADCSMPLIYLSFQGMTNSCSSAVFLGLSWHAVQRSSNNLLSPTASSLGNMPSWG